MYCCLCSVCWSLFLSVPKDFEEKLDSHRDNLEALEGKCQDLVDNGYMSDPDTNHAQVDGLKKQHGKMKERARQRKSDLESTMDRLKNYHNGSLKVDEEIERLIEVTDDQKPVASDVGQIQQQQEEFRKLQKEEVEPLQKQVDAMNKAGQALIQSAAPGVSTAALDSDMDCLNDRWTLLNEKISDRERKLDTALLQSGKFKDALASLLVWLAEMEEMVANQKPPSAEYKVVKAQMQEQKVRVSHLCGNM